MYVLDDFDFVLPPELIAQTPLTKRSASRLLCVSESLSDQLFTDLPKYLQAGDLLVFNDTQVIQARLFGNKESGGRIEVLIERVLDDQLALAQIRASHAPKPNSLLILEEAIHVDVIESLGDGFFALRFPSDVFALLDQYGHLPLPPYITHDANSFDQERYQTVYAKTPGAVAAPTAGLHFDESIFAELMNQGVQCAYLTLHVGAGTFQPVRVNDLTQHKMHTEHYFISEELIEKIHVTKAAGRKVIAVGTTSLRALESAAQKGSGKIQPGHGQTNLFITPGYSFQVVDRLITNFHLPKSTLLMLVSAFAGYEQIRGAYQHAIKERYRFFSYGDAMLLDGGKN